jgi:hypothetical protein
VRVLISVRTEGCLEDIPVSDQLTAIGKDVSTLSNCGVMTDASVTCGHVPSFWKFPDRCFRVHGCALVLRPSSCRTISLPTDSRTDRKV